MSVWHREDVSLVALITDPRNIASFVESDSLTYSLPSPPRTFLLSF